MCGFAISATKSLVRSGAQFHGVQSIPQVFRSVKVRALCRQLEFFHSYPNLSVQLQYMLEHALGVFAPVNF